MRLVRREKTRKQNSYEHNIFLSTTGICEQLKLRKQFASKITFFPVILFACHTKGYLSMLTW